MTKAVAKRTEETAVVVASTGIMTPMEMLNAAIERGDGLDKLERLMDLNDRWEKAQAKKAFAEAKTAFKANAPTIIKDMENKQYGSTYSSLGNVVNTVNEALSKYGLDASWEFDQGDKEIKVTCILTHLLGHSERVSLSGPPDTSGAKNPIQQIKSTTTYLKLATFEAVTGVASKAGSADDDGNGAGRSATITEEQAADLKTLMEKANLEDQIIFEHFKVAALTELTPDQLKTATAKLNKKLVLSS